MLPVLKKGPAVGASDVAFLDSRISEHEKVHTTCEALGKAAQEVHEQGLGLLPITGTCRWRTADAALFPHLSRSRC